MALVVVEVVLLSVPSQFQRALSTWSAIWSSRVGVEVGVRVGVGTGVLFTSPFPPMAWVEART